MSETYSPVNIHRAARIYGDAPEVALKTWLYGEAAAAAQGEASPFPPPYRTESFATQGEAAAFRAGWNYAYASHPRRPR